MKRLLFSLCLTLPIFPQCGKMALNPTTGKMDCIGNYTPSRPVPTLPANTGTLVDSGVKAAKWMSTDRKRLYGGDSTTLWQSVDDGTTWTQIKASLNGSIQGIRELSNGELLVSCYGTPGTLMLSSGFPKRGANATWSTVLTASGGGVEIYIQGQWGMSTYKNLAFVSEYGNKTAPNNARYVYMSQNYGVTWSTVFDLNTVVPSAGTGDHVHGVAYDPFWKRLWVVNGDTHQATSYSDDLGTTWTVIDTVHQFVGILPMERAVLFSTDDTQVGIWRLARTVDRSLSAFEWAYSISNSGVLTYLGTQPFQASGVDMPALFPFAADSASGSGLVIATYDGYRFSELWRDSISYQTGKGPTYVVGPTVSGNYAGTVFDARQAHMSELTLPAAPTPTIDQEIVERTAAINAAMGTLAQSAPGYYYSTASSATSTSTRSDGVLYASPVYIPRICILDRIGMEVTVAGSANSVLRLGVYASNSYGQPGARMLDAGTIDGTSATYQEIAIALTIPSPGWYWVAAAPQGSPSPTQPTMRVSTGNTAGMGWSTASVISSGSGSTGYNNNSVAGALPDPFTISGASGTIPRVIVRIQN